ncbi:MAG: phage portal protein [Leptolyngbya sp. PLA3]|nr:MAG: phage portal protein [Cyanobacteria bacterium CYA]MCE7968564.1 phage portal protein [Leptolyngbya sp. PL-A3]
MSYRLEAFSSVGLDEALLRLVIDEHTSGRIPRLAQLWTYFRNPLEPVGAGESSARLPAQHRGLPPRLVTPSSPVLDDRSRSTREIVVENDIAWRIATMVDFMFGKPVQLLSTADDEPLRRTIERLLDAIWERSGGIALLQDMALLAHVYGYVDMLVRLDEPALSRAGALAPGDDASHLIERIAAMVSIEIIEPTRGIPIVSPEDYRGLDAYVVHFEREVNQTEPSRQLRRTLFARQRPQASAAPRRRRSAVTEIFGPGLWQRYEDEQLVDEAPSALLPGLVPIVHVQNMAQPFRYEGLSEVEPLIPLQDELNTRLSDRANRVTMQSFKMYLATGLDGFDRVPVAPGQIWVTDNPDAKIESFGGDADSPSERVHIDEIREAMDKISAVPPLAGGVIRAKIGNLSSATALKVTLMGLLAKTARKRVTYGRGLTGVCELVLAALDAAGVLRTSPQDRRLRVLWPDPLPVEPGEEVAAARNKIELGVPAERVLGELGYAASDPGIA